MKAVGYTAPGPISGLTDVEIDKPTATGQDLLVQVHAVSVNPVDTKVRANRPVEVPMAVLGWDAAGEVVEVGPDVTEFSVGDAVWYAGAINRPGTNAEFHLVDERIVGRKPASLSFADAAAMPLTTLTAWEMLFDRLRVTDPVPGAAPAVVIIGGAGGVGSIAIQLLKARTNLTVIATASRPATQAWCTEMGADHVINHQLSLTEQIDDIHMGKPGFVFSTTHTGEYMDQIAEFIAPQGRFGLIDDPAELNIKPFKQKSISTHWEFMYTRSLFGTEDIESQRTILNEVSAMIDAGTLRSTATEVVGTINAANLRAVHTSIESGKACGKLVLEGF